MCLPCFNQRGGSGEIQQILNKQTKKYFAIKQFKKDYFDDYRYEKELLKKLQDD